jgi:hypothetical protein
MTPIRSFSERARNPFDGGGQIFVLDDGVDRLKLAVALDENGLVSVDHDFGNSRIGDQMRDGLQKGKNRFERHRYKPIA